MKSINVLKRESQIKQLIASIIMNDLTNSNIYNPTLIDCELSADLSHVKVFMAFEDKELAGLEALKNASGYIRKILSKSLNWRKVPEIHFYIDEVEKEGQKINRILEMIKNEQK
ncbi:Ribosome-binding factor A [Mycoplasmopsis maculosa]|uniref:Ribosome-binding factor A n=1 Tax=Mycoplasmopsis maculosa TaxID=114885 RepID=A0A449B501_9BACT|nr:30S ribosome-binding factor RbfA [Mycoplasmopsis maculosa]VEU75684.1 Ribosome-binding factor A [Mycoplasmopsis maculosa]